MISPRQRAQQTLVGVPAAATATSARPAWRQAAAVAARTGGWIVAACRRWDAHQERLARLAAKRGNVHLLYPRV
jgi:hypothetical protein